MRIVFMGTPQFAVPSLEALIDSSHEVVAVITATDKWGGRGKKQLLESDVKKCAQAHEIPVLQPKNLKNPDFIEELAQFKADLQVVVAFRMLPEIVWNMPPEGTMNLHGSLLPKYRGAAPIHWAVINGEKETGATTFLLKHEIDTGDLIDQVKIDIGSDDTTGDVHDEMMLRGAELVRKSVDAIAANQVRLKPQDSALVSKAPKIHHEDCVINFAKSAQEIHNFIRGMSPFPTAYTHLDDKELKILRAKIYSEDDLILNPKQILVTGSQRLLIGTSDHPIEIMELKLAGKRKMKTKDFLNGYTIMNEEIGKQKI